MLGGADLFLQGFIAPEGGLPAFRANDAVAIVVPGNRFPLAVGLMECDTAQARAAGMKVCSGLPPIGSVRDTIMPCLL